MATGLAFLRDFLAHDTGKSHPERPERLTALLAHLHTHGPWDSLQQLDATRDRDVGEWALTVHTATHLAAIATVCDRAPAYLDPDTPVSPKSLEVARHAVGAALNACDAVMADQVSNAFCAVRPPGHHAEPGRPMGFCLLNTVAIAARYLQQHHGLDRILIIDWDVHHGNGTQFAFYDDPSVFYFSIHQAPFYPGTGAADETGQGAGLGTTLNVPLAAGQDDAAYVHALKRHLVPAAESFKPDFILVSAGFDAHRDDPLAGMCVSEAGFAKLSEIVVGLAHDLCRKRLVSVLEGGYDLNALARSVAAHLTVLQSC